MDLSQKLIGVVRTIESSVQVPGHKSRNFTLEMDFSECTIEDVVHLAMLPKRITWANNNRSKGDAHLASLPKVIKLTVRPIGTRGPVDVEYGFMAKAETMDIDDLDRQIERLEAIRARKVASGK